MELNKVKIYQRCPCENGWVSKERRFRSETLENILKSPSREAVEQLIFVVDNKAYTLLEFKELREKSTKRIRYKKPNEKEKLKALELRDKGFSYREVSQRTGIPKGSLTHLFKNLDVH